MKQTIQMKVINNKIDQVVLRFDRPGRMEISVVDGRAIIHVYDGFDIDMGQEPIMHYSGYDRDDYDNGTVLVSRPNDTDGCDVPPGYERMFDLLINNPGKGC